MFFLKLLCWVNGLEYWFWVWRIDPGSGGLVGGLEDRSPSLRIGRRAGGSVFFFEDWSAGWGIGLASISGAGLAAEWFIIYMLLLGFSATRFFRTDLVGGVSN